jgi:hypothetical protein
MAAAYVPGLKVADRLQVRKVRRLPIPGEVLVQPGQRVRPDDVVARAQLPGNPQTVNVAHGMSVDPSDVPGVMLKRVGDEVAVGEVIARSRGMFGFGKRELKSPVAGRIELISPVTGQVTLREPPIPIEVTAYLSGRVAEVLPREGVVIETVGAMIQGIFGVGGERRGEIAVAVAAPDEVLDAPALQPEHQGKVVVGGSLVTAAALRRAAEVGVSAVVVGGIVDTDLVAFIGHDLGVAITGQENVPFTLILTEGFGRIAMADRTWALLGRLRGRAASVNGATQIRAGVMRPEVIVPEEGAAVAPAADGSGSGALEVGTLVRLIREPFFGRLAEVVELPAELQQIETEAHVRVLRARLRDGDGRVLTIPRANVEILES